MDVSPYEKKESFFLPPVRTGYRGVRAVGKYILNLFDKPLIVLLYHQVTEISVDPEMLAVSPGNFRRHLIFLKRHYHLARLDEDWSGLRKPAVVITFDDGYADNVHEALPILEEVGVPATFFVASGNIGTGREFWWHQLESILLGGGLFPADFELKDSIYGQCWETVTAAQRKVLYVSLNRLMKKVGTERREDWLGQLRVWAGLAETGRSRHRTMSREEIKRLAASPWATVGAHTVTHSALSALSEEEQRREIFSSKSELGQITGREITTFSYPYGQKKDYDRFSVRLCREAGFRKAASNFPGQVHRWTDPLQLPRHLVRNWDLDIFAGEIKRFWTA